MKTLIAILGSIALSLTLNASPKGDSNTRGHSTVLQSGIKSLGTIGKGDRYEVSQIKVRGLDTPNLTAVVIYDRTTDELLIVGPASAPGLGVAIVNGGASVGGSFLFGSKIRPSNQNIDNGSQSSANTVANVHSQSNANAASVSHSSNHNENTTVNTQVNSAPTAPATPNCGPSHGHSSGHSNGHED